MTASVEQAPAVLPYTSRPRLGRGVRVDRTARSVVIAGQAYTPEAARELADAIALAADQPGGGA